MWPSSGPAGATRLSFWRTWSPRCPSGGTSRDLPSARPNSSTSGGCALYPGLSSLESSAPLTQPALLTKQNPPSLEARLPPRDEPVDGDRLLELFLAYVEELGVEL